MDGGLIFSTVDPESMGIMNEYFFPFAIRSSDQSIEASSRMAYLG